MWAGHNGYEGEVKVLLGRDDVNPNKTCGDDRTPLLRAAENGYEGVVKILLGRDDIDSNRPDLGG